MLFHRTIIITLLFFSFSCVRKEKPEEINPQHPNEEITHQDKKEAQNINSIGSKIPDDFPDNWIEVEYYEHAKDFYVTVYKNDDYYARRVQLKRGAYPEIEVKENGDLPFVRYSITDVKSDSAIHFQLKKLKASSPPFWLSFQQIQHPHKLEPCPIWIMKREDLTYEDQLYLIPESEKGKFPKSEITDP